jgi:hypothetical protein
MIVTKGSLVRHKKTAQLYRVATLRKVELEGVGAVCVQPIKIENDEEKIAGVATFVLAENLEAIQ